jgi:hypothetical protein
MPKMGSGTVPCAQSAPPRIECALISGYTADMLEQEVSFLQKPFTPGCGLHLPATTPELSRGCCELLGVPFTGQNRSTANFNSRCRPIRGNPRLPVSTLPVLTWRFPAGRPNEQRRLGYLHAVARDRKRQQQAQFFGFQVPAIGRHVCGSTEIRVAIWAGPIRSPASERSGPRRPPQPEIVWQYSQPLSSKTLAPSAIGPVATPTTDAGKGGASSRGDHGARAPAQPPSFRPGVLRLWRWRIRLQAVLLVGSHGGRQRCVP